MRKNALLVLTVLFLSASRLFAFDGYMTGGKNIRYVRTQWFDIIYPEGTEESAAEIAGCADSIYEEICADLGISPSFRMPVAITSDIDVYNAYFTNGYYNHIVLFDTLPDEDLAVFCDTLTGTFRHELTHAVTINMRNPFWKFIDMIFGDAVNLGTLVTMPTLIKEGASVSAESLPGEGRLNDPYYMHMARQAKVMDKFPSYADVAGALDVYPSTNMSYGFGGPFTLWLQNKYGMEKYAVFWYTGINVKTITYGRAFKKVYGFSLKSAWKEFEESLEVPEICEDISVSNFQSSPGAVYSSICLSGDCAFWFDRSSGKVYRTKLCEDGSFEKPEKIFSNTYIHDLGPSTDPRYLAACEYDYLHANLKTSVFLYSLESGKKISVKEKSLRNPFVVKNEGESFFCAVQVNGQSEKILVYKILEDEKGPISLEKFSETDLPRGLIIFSPCDAGDGVVACIAQDSMVQSVRLFYNLFDENLPMQFSDIALPDEKIRIRDLAALSPSSESSFRQFVFSWASEKTFPRMGLLSLNGSCADFELMEGDISGGVYSPVILKGSDGEISDKLLCIGDFVKETKVLSVDMKSFEKKSLVSSLSSAREVSADENQNAQTVESLLADSKRWLHPFYYKGLLVPVSDIPVYEADGTLSSKIVFPGLSWITGNAWDGTNLLLSFGVNPGGFLTALQDDKFEIGFEATLSGGSTTNLFKYSLSPAVIMDSSGFMQASLSSTVKSTFAVGKCSFVLQNENFVFFGKQHPVRRAVEDYVLLKITDVFDDDREYLTVKNTATAVFSTVRSTGPGRFEYGGFMAQLLYRMSWRKCFGEDFSNPTDGVFSHVLFPAVAMRIPKLIPVDCVYGMTYNLPVSVKAFLVPEKNCLFDVCVKTVIFSADIQRGLTFFPLYFNRIVALASYDMGFYDEGNSVTLFNCVSKFKDFSSMKFSDCLTLSFGLEGALNTGVFASSSMVQSLGMDIKYYPHSDVKIPFEFQLATSLSL
ncbi:MAG: hypothetical protein ILP07_07020 [Treponema sp.]|nr:hypothetical protein [Treponema sp.]